MIVANQKLADLRRRRSTTALCPCPRDQNYHHDGPDREEATQG